MCPLEMWAYLNSSCIYFLIFGEIEVELGYRVKHSKVLNKIFIIFAMEMRLLSSKGSFNNYVNKLRWVGGQSIVYANKVNDPSLFTESVY